MKKKHVKRIVERIDLNLFGQEFEILVRKDRKYGKRVFIQIQYEDECRSTREVLLLKGRKWYLSEFMTEDEIVKTCYAAFEACVKHEIMEGFCVDGQILFNPHVNFEELLKISSKEIKREPHG